MKYLTPLSERKGKGGRQPAADPRNNPAIDPKKAQRIINNRISAAKSKIKQKQLAQTLRKRLECLHKQRQEANVKVDLVKAKVERENKRAMDLDLRLRTLRQEADG
ncbi:hypothetical protein H632_c1450p1 [Helicosporidium sp. ATCC 50920]|nr:hypothetical protein H632_c1450p1 [Helicosporidium sp. ATCC 50920]|eukprot:KDD74262.1 hypothetical protein H632_c1450p1 [Helicosporidium sp. ATCC 50920]